jgi:hypothetical protein
MIAPHEAGGKAQMAAAGPIKTAEKSGVLRSRIR